MSLRTRSLLLIGATLLGLLVIMGVTAHLILDKSYAVLEQEDTRRNLERALNLIAEVSDNLDRNARDYGYWDDTYRFARERNADYLTNNFFDETFSNNRWSLVMILDREGRGLYRQGFDLKSGEMTEVPAAWRSEPFPVTDYLNLTGTDGHRTGIVLFDEGPMLIAVRGILQSSLAGENAGAFIVGRALDAAEVERLSQATRMPLELYPVAATDLPDDLVQGAMQLDADRRTRVQVLDDERLAGQGLLLGADGRPALFLRVVQGRVIFQQGHQALDYLLIALGLIGAAFAVVMVVVLERMVLRRVANLSADALRIGASGDFSRRVRMEGKDEIGVLGASMNVMLNKFQEMKQMVDYERERSDKLLLNVLPRAVVDRLKQGHGVIAESYADVTILFADIVDFTRIAAAIDPQETVALLDEVFSTFDWLAEVHGLEKIKTIGDAYMVVGGLPEERADHAAAVLAMALDMQKGLERINSDREEPVRLRIGINSGPVVAGIVGTRKFFYDLWGDTVNIASRMESAGVPGCIQVTAATRERAGNGFLFELRGPIEVKGKGEMEAYFLAGRLGHAPAPRGIPGA